MKLDRLIKNLQGYKKKYGNLELVYASDDECNRIESVKFDPTPMKKVELTYITTKNGHRYTKGWYYTPRNSIDRSRTFPGIAKAMAEQWG